MKPPTSRPVAKPKTDKGVGEAQRDHFDETAHELRNAMNSLLMNAAALTARPDQVPQELQMFAQQVNAAGQRCSQLLSQLLDAKVRSE